MHRVSALAARRVSMARGRCALSAPDRRYRHQKSARTPWHSRTRSPHIFPHDAARTHACGRDVKKKTEKRNPDRRRAGPRWDSVGRRAARFGRGRFFPDRQIRRDSSVPLRHRAHTCAYIPFVPRTSGVHRLSARPGRKTDAGRSLTVSPIVHAACPPQMASRSTRSPVFVIAFHLKAYELIRAPVDESDVVRRVLKGDGDNVNALWFSFFHQTPGLNQLKILWWRGRTQLIAA